MTVPVPDEWLAALQDSAVFDEFGGTELERIAALAEERAVPSNSPIGAQGEHSRELFVLLEGAVHVPSPTGQQTVLVLAPHDTYGLGGLVSPGRLLASAVTSGACRFLVIPIGSLRALAEADTEFGRRLYYGLAREMAHRFEEVVADAQGRPRGNYLPH